MEASRRQLVLLGSILALLAIVLYWQVTRGDQAPAAVAAPAQSPAQSGTAGAARRQAGTSDLPVIALASLGRAQPEPADTGRDPFRFGAAPEPRPSGGPAGPRGLPAEKPGQAVAPAVPAEPPGPPPITLKFIGIAKQGAAGRLYAVLRDERGIYYGAEGDVVEGRYRVIRVTPDVVDVSYVDGRGRVNIPLSGGQT